MVLPFLYTAYRFNTDPLSALIYPVFRRATPFIDDRDYRRYKSLSVVQSGEQLAASATEDAQLYLGTLHLWDTDTLRTQRSLTDPTLGFTGFLSVVNPQVTALAAAGNAYVGQVLNAETGEVSPALASDGFVNDIVVSADGSQVIAAQWSDDSQRWQVNFVNAQTGELERSIVPELKNPLDEIYRMALSSQGDLLAIALPQSVQIWSVKDNALLHSITAKPRIYTSGLDTKSEILTFSADGSRLTVLERAAHFKQVNTETGKVTYENQNYCFDNTLAISPSGEQYVCSYDSYTKDDTVVTEIGSLVSDEPPAMIEGIEITDHNALSADGQSLLVKQSSEDYSVYNIATKEKIALQNDEPENWIRMAAFNRDRTAILVHLGTKKASDDSGRYLRQMKILDANTLKPISSLSLPVDHLIYKVDLAEETLTIQKQEDVLNFWRVNPDGIRHQRSFFSDVIRYPKAVAFSPEGETFAAMHIPDDGSGNNIAIGDVSSGKISQTFSLNRTDYRDLSFSADKENIITTYVGILNSNDETKYTHHLEIWNLSTGEITQRFDLLSSSDSALLKDTSTSSTPPYSASFALSDDGTRLLTRTKEAVRLWNAETGELMRTLVEYDSKSLSENLVIKDVAISRDNRWAAFAGDNGKLSIWSLDTGEPLRTLTLKALPVFEKGKDYVDHLSFSPDRRMLFATSGSQVIRWQLPARLSLFGSSSATD